MIRGEVIVDEGYFEPVGLNMAYDEALFKSFVEKDDNIIVVRFYGWKYDCFSYGYGYKIKRVRAAYSRYENRLIRRPTGGGIVNHTNDISYCVIARIDSFPFFEDLKSSYKILHKGILRGIRQVNSGFVLLDKDREHEDKLNYCFQNHVESDIVLGSRKVVGSAQKRSQGVLMQQGTINMPEFNFAALAVIKALGKIVTEGLSEELGIDFEKRDYSYEEKRLAHEFLESKYLKDEWNFRR